MFGFQVDGWLLEWLKQALTPGVALAVVAISVATWRATTDYARLKHLEVAVQQVHLQLDNMATKDDLNHSVSEMEARLERLAGERFLGSKDLALINAVAAKHEDQIGELRHHLFELLRAGTARASGVIRDDFSPGTA